MYLLLFKEMVRNYTEVTREREQSENTANVLPRRCEICHHLPYCDQDFCLCWYH
jgi:hypothetical protein